MTLDLVYLTVFFLFLFEVRNEVDAVSSLAVCVHSGFSEMMAVAGDGLVASPVPFYSHCFLTQVVEKNLHHR